MNEEKTKCPTHLNKSVGLIGKVGSIVTSKLFAAIMAFTMASLIGLEAGAATLCLIGLNTEDGGDGGTLLGGDGDGDGDGGAGDGDGGGDGGGDGDTPWTADMSDEMKEFFGDSKSLKEFQENMPKAAEVPDSYEIPEALAEGLDKDRIDAFFPKAKEQGFTQSQMDFLLNYEAESSAAFPEQMYAATQAVMAEGLAEMKTSLGDAAYGETITGAKLYRDNLPPELKKEAVEFFDTTGMGNHPTLIKILAAYSQRFKEDAFTGGGLGDGGKSELTPAQRMYPNQGKK